MIYLRFLHVSQDCFTDDLPFLTPSLISKTRQCWRVMDMLYRCKFYR